jgi:hypothetical protein
MTWDAENIINVEFPKVLQEIEEFLRPNDYGFELVHVGAVPNTLPSILYQSKQCKLRIQSLRDRPYEEIEIYPRYGRLHAPLDKETIIWNDDKCYCWHSLEWDPVLNFLDGLSPAEIVNRDFELPRAIKVFTESIKEEKYKEEIRALQRFSESIKEEKDKEKLSSEMWSRAKYFSKKHAFLWKYYGQRLFDLFDLNHPDLWEEYRHFLKEYYVHSDKKSKQKNFPIYPYDPPKHKVC